MTKEEREKEAEAVFELTFSGLKELILSRAWCKHDYETMDKRIEGIRNEIKQRCYLPALAKRPELTEKLVMALLEDNDDKNVYKGLELYDMLTMDLEE